MAIFYLIVAVSFPLRNASHTGFFFQRMCACSTGTIQLMAKGTYGVFLAWITEIIEF